MINFNNEQEVRDWLKHFFPYKEISEEDIDEKIIEYFGEEALEELNVITKLDCLNFRLADFLGIEPVPIIFEEMEEDSRYYLDEDYISISKKFISDEVEQWKCLIHEVKHLQQRYCIAHMEERLKFAPLINVINWDIDFHLDYNNMPDEEKICLPIEIDAFAFTKYILKEWFKIDYHHYDPFYDYVLDKYIESYYK